MAREMEHPQEHPLRRLSSPLETLDSLLPGLDSHEAAERFSELRSFFEQDCWKGLWKRVMEERVALIERCIRALAADERPSSFVAGQADGLRIAIEKIPLEMLEEAAKAKVNSLEEEPEPTDRY